MIKLPRPVKFSDVIQPANLACSWSADLDVIAVGNGLTPTDRQTPFGTKDILPFVQYAELTTILKTECLIAFPLGTFRKSVICAKGDGMQSTCENSEDIGGPLIEPKSRTLIGMSLYGSPIFGCKRGAAQGFVNISEYVSWIEQNTGIKCKKPATSPPEKPFSNIYTGPDPFGSFFG